MLVFKEINRKLSHELAKKKDVMEKELKESEEIYLRKESIKKKLKELKEDSEK